MSKNLNSIWIVTREYYRIAEAGGVKVVSSSLAENLAKLGVDVTVFIPSYGCTDYSLIKDLKKTENDHVSFSLDNVPYNINFSCGTMNGVKIVFVQNNIFSEKRDVYVYTEEEERENPAHRRGTGHEDSFQMNSVFQQALLHYGILNNVRPQIVHCQDAAVAMTGVFARNFECFNEFYKNTKFVVTIHNAGPGYHHSFPDINFAERMTGLSESILSLGYSSQNHVIEPFLLASEFCYLTTVSPWYAEEIFDQSNEYSLLAIDFNKKNVKITGITNGIDYDNYNPMDTSVSLLDFPFDCTNGNFDGKFKCRRKFFSNMKEKIAECGNLNLYGNFDSISENTSIIVFHGRLVYQKGIEIFTNAAHSLLEQNRDVCFLVIGRGQDYLENLQVEMSKQYKGRYVYIQGYERKIARTCVAAGDFLLLPSLFEPCCLEDYIGQIYGTLPVAHAVGGLNKIVDGSTGFLYSENSSEAVADVVNRILNLKETNPDNLKKIIRNAAITVKNTFSWEKIIKDEYMKLYNGILSET